MSEHDQPGAGNGDEFRGAPPAMRPFPHLELPPNPSIEDLAKAHATMAIDLYHRIPELNTAVERIEAAALVASGAAHEAKRIAVSAAQVVGKMVKRLENRISALDTTERTVREQLTKVPDVAEHAASEEARSVAEESHRHIITEVDLKLAARQLDSERARRLAAEEQVHRAEKREQRTEDDKSKKRWAVWKIVIALVLSHAVAVAGGSCHTQTAPPAPPPASP
jgi:hypothetical protein